MADKETETKKTTEQNGQNDDKSEEKDDSNLENFITEQYRLQEAQRQAESGGGVDIEADRIANFFARSLGESQRMSHEVEKSQAKMTMLHEELGAERFTSWQHEHATEVLTPEQVAAVTNASHGNF